MKKYVSTIIVGSTRRKISAATVGELADSIKRIGLINPITITEDNQLIAGAHRLEAYRMMGMQEIECNVMSLSGMYVELAAIDENLIRNDLHYLDRGEQLARRKAIYETLYPETRQGAVNQYTKVQSAESAGSKPSFVDDVAEKTGHSSRTIHEELQTATIGPEAKQLIRDNDITKTEAIIVARMEPEKQVEAVAQIIAMKPHVSNNSGNNEWYTPGEYIDIARTVMGAIDCDPASSDIANETVEAETYFTSEDNGLEQEWNGNVFLNPPYAQPLIQQFAEKLIAEIDKGRVEQACVLVNNATETQWFQTMARKASAIWFIKGRIKFLDIHGNANGAPLQGQCMLYFGKNTDVFIQNCAGFVCACQYV